MNHKIDFLIDELKIKHGHFIRYRLETFAQV